MKLTIIRLEKFSDQDRIDLQKIWPGVPVEALERPVLQARAGPGDATLAGRARRDGQRWIAALSTLLPEYLRVADHSDS